MNKSSMSFADEKTAAQKQLYLDPERLLDSIPGGVGIFLYTDHLENMYVSNGVAALVGCTREEYACDTEGDALRFICAEDRPVILAAAARAAKGDSFDQTYRIYTKNKELLGVRITAVCIKKDEDGSLFHAILQTPYKMQQRYDTLVSESKSAVYVNAVDNYDLLYVNDAGTRLLHTKGTPYAGLKCYEFFMGLSAPCPFCKMLTMNKSEFLERDFQLPGTDRILRMQGKLIDWNGMDAHVEYIEDVTEDRKNSQRLLEAQRDLKKLQGQTVETLNSYRALVNTVPGAIVQYEVDGDKVLTKYYSDGLCALTGYTRQERDAFNKQDAMSLVFEEDVPYVTQAMQTAIRTKSNLDLTYRIKTKSGQPHYVNLKATYLRGENGKPEFHTVFSDVDRLKRMETTALEQQLRYETAVKSSGIDVWEYDILADRLTIVSHSSRFSVASPVIEHYTATILQTGCVRADSVEAFSRAFDRMRQGEKEIIEDIWFRIENQTSWWCERVIYTTVFDSHGKPVKAFGAGRDVTREKDAIKKFNEEMSYRAAVQGSDSFSIKLNLTHNTVLEGDASAFPLGELADCPSADAYFERTLHYLVGDACKADYRRIFNRLALLDRFSCGDFSVSAELTRMFDVNRIFWMKYSVHLRKNPENNDIIAFVISTDITDQKVMELVMQSIVHTDYDFLAVVEGITNSAMDYAVTDKGTQLFPKDCAYETRVEELLREYVCAEDVEWVVSACKIDTVFRYIENGKLYKFNFGIHTKTGQLRRKQLQFTLINTLRKTFLMTMIDVNAIFTEQKQAQLRLEPR